MTWPLRWALLAATLGAVLFPSARGQQTVDTLDFFGLRQVTEAQVRAKLPLKEGDPFDRSRVGAIVAELKTIPGVVNASVAPITVSGGSLRLFIGIEEKGVRGFVLRPKPTGAVRLAPELVQLYRDTMTALSAAVRNGNAREDHAHGHALSADPAQRKLQDAAIARLAGDADLVPQLRQVLALSSEPLDRTAAAWLLGYAPDKRAVVDDLVEAARDADGGVRNNATRALGVIAEFAAAHPELGVTIAPDLFVAMLGSITWTDRNKAVFLLDGLTKTRSPALLRTLQTDALPDLIDIARWRSEGHAYAGVRILGRIAGWSDPEIARAVRDRNVLEQLIVAATP